MTHTGRYILPLCVAVIAVYFLYLVRDILLPFALAGTLAYILNPAVDFFMVRGFRRSPIVIIIFALLVTFFTGGVYLGAVLVSHEATRMAVQMPEYVQKGQHYLSELRAGPKPGSEIDKLERLPIFRWLPQHGDLLNEALQHARNWPSAIVQQMPSVASHLIPLLELAFLVPFITFFFMMEGPDMLDALLQGVPARYVEMSLNILVEIDASLGNYVRGLSLEALSVGLIALAGFWLIGLDYSFQIAVLVGLANLIPYVGPLVGGLLGGAVAIFQWGTMAGVLKVFAVCVSVRFIEDWFLQPVILKRAVHLHPVVIVFTLMAGTTLWGFWGLLFAVPAACMVKVLLQVLWQWYRSEYGVRPIGTPAEVSHIPLI